ncbi:MAG: hypothetical protein P8O03_05720 [Ilumatobacter sp.]|nr:hypothetical protein [Ilumatobacter sp.]MDG2040510.1 hypothetical protein [Ilumatobacter sp.]
MLFTWVDDAARSVAARKVFGAGTSGYSAPVLDSQPRKQVIG